MKCLGLVRFAYVSLKGEPPWASWHPSNCYQKTDVSGFFQIAGTFLGNPVVLFVSMYAAVCHGKECVRFLFMLQSGVGGGKQ